MLMNSRSDWLKSGTYRSLPSMNGESICVPVFAQRPIFRVFTVGSWTTGQLDKPSAKVTEIWTKCALYVLL